MRQFNAEMVHTVTHAHTEYVYVYVYLYLYLSIYIYLSISIYLSKIIHILFGIAQETGMDRSGVI